MASYSSYSIRSISLSSIVCRCGSDSADCYWAFEKKKKRANNIQINNLLKVINFLMLNWVPLAIPSQHFSHRFQFKFHSQFIYFFARMNIEYDVIVRFLFSLRLFYFIIIFIHCCQRLVKEFAACRPTCVEMFYDELTFC